jgi:hypothetical protein
MPTIVAGILFEKARKRRDDKGLTDVPCGAASVNIEVAVGDFSAVGTF